MSRPAPTDSAVPARWTAEEYEYLALVDRGVLGPDDPSAIAPSCASSSRYHSAPIPFPSPTLPSLRRYRNVSIVRRGETIEVAALPGVRVAVGDLLPSR